MRSRDDFVRQRETMVRTQLVARGLRDPRVLDAMRRVPRERFVLPDYLDRAFDDGPLPIGQGQTISQPYIVALMTELLELTGTERVLEVGTGSGYQTAVLAEVASEVYTVEIVESLAERARGLLGDLGYRNVRFRVGDGTEGWLEHAPYDRILVAAAPRRFPPELGEQLVVGGWAIVPVGGFAQELHRVRRTETGFETERGIGVRFVPMVGKASEL
jgi:protein-L-isoaspartate(D-aspartate) O-methyltransferase